jgi:hypothetical protein
MLKTGAPCPKLLATYRDDLRPDPLQVPKSTVAPVLAKAGVDYLMDPIGAGGRTVGRGREAGFDKSWRASPRAFRWPRAKSRIGLVRQLPRPHPALD